MQDHGGSAIIYCATRRGSRETAEFLTANGLQSDYFHGQRSPEQKKDVQNRVISGDLKTICATSAFGMGIDKPDVRIVVHADIPGSLENYLQEAGRVGRDNQQARCVLLYDPADPERQHSLQARNRLSKKDIDSMLRSLRRLEWKQNRNAPTGRENSLIIATTGEILNEDEENDFDHDDTNQEDKGRTAIAWLEETHLLARHDNRTSVFPSSIIVNSLSEASQKLDQLSSSNQNYVRQLRNIVSQI